MTDKELEKVLQDIRYDRQMRKKRLYEQAKRQRKQEAKRESPSNK
jgi:hypothetical protein